MVFIATGDAEGTPILMTPGMGPEPAAPFPLEEDIASVFEI